MGDVRNIGKCGRVVHIVLLQKVYNTFFQDKGNLKTEDEKTQAH